eukprot:11961421-Alexandrium_andersonii.AAC.1
MASGVALESAPRRGAPMERSDLGDWARSGYGVVFPRRPTVTNADVARAGGARPHHPARAHAAGWPAPEGAA